MTTNPLFWLSLALLAWGSPGPSGERLSRPAALVRAAPPEQPTSGPGSSEYAHRRVRETNLGSGGTAFTIFEPADPVPAAAPVVVFMHGFGATDSREYGDWITHLVRRGNIVVFPVYQADTLPPSEAYTPDAVAAVVEAYAVLRGGGHVQPDPELLGLVGHSLGASLAANLASLLEDAGLPAPRAMVLACAADTGSGPLGRFSSVLDDADHTRTPADMLVLSIVAEEDRVVGEGVSRVVLEDLPQIPRPNKEIVELCSDDYGTPVLRATHAAPSWWTTVNAIDFYGFWKLSDGLLDAGFYGLHREYALGGTYQQAFMGRWSDDRPVNPAVVIGP